MENYNGAQRSGVGSPAGVMIDPDEGNVVYASGSIDIENPNMNSS